MLRLDTYPISCGIRFICGESTYRSVDTLFNDMAKLKWDSNAHSMYVWTHNIEELTIGEEMTTYIEKNGLGIVVKSAPGGNPIHGHRKIAVWTWSRDNEAFRKHCDNLRAVVAEKYAKEQAERLAKVNVLPPVEAEPAVVGLTMTGLTSKPAPKRSR